MLFIARHWLNQTGLARHFVKAEHPTTPLVALENIVGGGLILSRFVQSNIESHDLLRSPSAPGPDGCFVRLAIVCSEDSFKLRFKDLMSKQVDIGLNEIAVEEITISISARCGRSRSNNTGA
jgi:hypothetical protein